MRVLSLAAVITALLAGCASLPQAPAQYTLMFAPVASETSRVAEPPLQVIDARNAADPLRIGEVHAPAGGRPPPIVPGPIAPALAGAILLLPTEPTGRYLVAGNPGGVPALIRDAIVTAWLRAGRTLEPDTLQASIRMFWIRPSWTTTCDIVVDLRVVDSSGVARSQQTIESHIDRFEGWFTVEAFERVGRLALDQFIENAIAAFRADGLGRPSGR